MDSVHVSELPPELVRRLPLGRKILLSAEILWIYCRVRLRLRRDELPRALGAFRAVEPRVSSAPESAATYQRAARLAWAVQRTLSLFPTDTRCLMQSLVLTRLLARRGVPTTLQIGVRPGDDFEAHAWVEYCGRPLLPDSQDRFELLSQL